MRFCILAFGKLYLLLILLTSQSFAANLTPQQIQEKLGLSSDIKTIQNLKRRTKGYKKLFYHKVIVRSYDKDNDRLTIVSEDPISMGSGTSFPGAGVVLQPISNIPHLPSVLIKGMHAQLWMAEDSTGIHIVAIIPGGKE